MFYDNMFNCPLVTLPTLYVRCPLEFPVYFFHGPWYENPDVEKGDVKMADTNRNHSDTGIQRGPDP